MPRTNHVFPVCLQVVFSADEASITVKEVPLIPGYIIELHFTTDVRVHDFRCVCFYLSVLKVLLVEQTITRVKWTSGRPV